MQRTTVRFGNTEDSPFPKLIFYYEGENVTGKIRSARIATSPYGEILLPRKLVLKLRDLLIEALPPDVE